MEAGQGEGRVSGGLFQRLRERRSATTAGPWSWSDPEKTGGRWPEPWFVNYTTDDDGLHGGEPGDLDCIAAEHNAMGPILDMLEKLDNQIAWRLNSRESGHWRDGLVDIRRQLRELGASQADETGEL